MKAGIFFRNGAHVLCFTVIFCSNRAVAEDFMVPPIVTPWEYTFFYCRGIPDDPPSKSFSDTVARGLAFGGDPCGDNRIRYVNGWGTPEKPDRACGALHGKPRPLWDYSLGIEILNQAGVGTEQCVENDPPSLNGFTVRRSRQVSCPDYAVVKNNRCVSPDALDKQAEPSCPEQPTAGNPVVILTGQKYESVTDYSTPSNNQLKISRSYSSTTGEWRFWFEQQIVRAPYDGRDGYLVAKRPYGNSYVFRVNNQLHILTDLSLIHI